MNSAPLITAVRGPLLLIILGVLFLADHFSTFEFTETWPTLIIAFGLMKLLERALGARRQEQGGVGT